MLFILGRRRLRPGMQRWMQVMRLQCTKCITHHHQQDSNLMRFYIYFFLLIIPHIELCAQEKAVPKRFQFVSEAEDGKSKYRLVNIPIGKQPLFINFFDGKPNPNTNEIETTLFEDHSLTKPLGVISASFARTDSVVFKGTSGNISTFRPDYYVGKCRHSEKHAGIQRILEVKQSKSRIGEGPWGKQAWTNSRVVEFEYLPLQYTFNGNSISNFMVRGDNYLSFSVFDSDLEAYSSYQMPVDFFFNEPKNVNFELDCDSYSSQEIVNKTEALTIDLAPQGFAPFGERHYSQMVSESHSEKERSFPCKLIHEEYSHFSRVNLSLSIDKAPDLIIMTYADSKMLSYPSRVSDTKFMFDEVRPKSSPIFFTLSQREGIQLSIHTGNSIMQEMRDTQITLIQPEKFYKHKITIPSVSEDSLIKIYVSNLELGHISPSKPFEFALSRGEYPMKIRTLRLNGESTEDHFIIKVEEDPKSAERIVDLSKVQMFKHLYLHYSDKSGDLSTNDVVTVKTLQKFSYVRDKEIDLSSYVQSNTLKPKNPAQLRDYLKPLGAGSLIAQGICNQSDTKKSYHSITVYSSPAETSNPLGAIKIKNNNESTGLDISFFKNDGSFKKFKPNFFSEGCENAESILAIHRVANVSGDWSDLGQGPWGQSGWVNIKAESVFERNLVFDVKGFGYGRLKKKTNKLYIFSPESYYGSDQDPNPKEVPRSKLINDEGKILPEIICQLGC